MHDLQLGDRKNYGMTGESHVGGSVSCICRPRASQSHVSLVASVLCQSHASLMSVIPPAVSQSHASLLPVVSCQSHVSLMPVSCMRLTPHETHLACRTHPVDGLSHEVHRRRNRESCCVRFWVPRQEAAVCQPRCWL